MRKKSVLITSFLTIAAILSSVYLLMLGYYALPTADDWGWARQASDLGSFGFVKAFYYGWQGRFSAILVDGTLCRILGWNEHLLLFTIIELLLGYGAVYLLLRDMAKIANGGTLALVSIIITNLGVMAFPEIGTFYWLCTANYIHEIWLTMYLIWFLFCAKTKWLQYSGVIICSVYLGGCAENYSPTLAFALGVLWLYLLICHHDWHFWRNTSQLLLFVSFMLIGIGFLFMLFAPGNDVRMSSEESHSLMQDFSLKVLSVKSIKASVVLLLRLFSRSWYFICAIPVLMYAGVLSEDTLPMLTWKKVIVSFLISIGFIVVSVVATVYGVGWYATMRANCFIVFILLGWLAYISVLFGASMKKHSKALVSGLVSASVAIVFTSVIYICEEYPIVRKYNEQVVTIHHQMQQYVKEGRAETVYIEPVKIPYKQSSYGYLRNALQILFHKSKRYNEHYFPYEPFQLSDNPKDWRNLFYQRWVGAQFEIICVNEKVD